MASPESMAHSHDFVGLSKGVFRGFVRLLFCHGRFTGGGGVVVGVEAEVYSFMTGV